MKEQCEHQNNPLYCKECHPMNKTMVSKCCRSEYTPLCDVIDYYEPVPHNPDGTCHTRCSSCGKACEVVENIQSKECYSCGGKGTYSQIHGISARGDFIGDKDYSEKPSIHNYPCSSCNGTGKTPPVEKEITLKDVEDLDFTETCDYVASREKEECEHKYRTLENINGVTGKVSYSKKCMLCGQKDEYISDQSNTIGREEDEVLSYCVRCGGKWLVMGKVLEWGKYYPEMKIKHEGGKIEIKPAIREIKKAICRNCCKETYDEENPTPQPTDQSNTIGSWEERLRKEFKEWNINEKQINYSSTSERISDWWLEKLSQATQEADERGKAEQIEHCSEPECPECNKVAYKAGYDEAVKMCVEKIERMDAELLIRLNGYRIKAEVINLLSNTDGK